MQKISLDEKFALFDEHWRPKTVAALNVCCPSARITPEDMRTRVLAETLEASTKITGALAS